MDNTFKPLNRETEVHRRRRYLPHWEQQGCTYFITFRTADSLPQAKLDQLEEERSIWLQFHPEPWSEGDLAEYHERFTEQIQEWLDAGYGACELRRPDIHSIVGPALCFFDEDRYVLDEFVVMPNHVHAILVPEEGRELEGILHSLKSFTSNKINHVLGDSGQFWMDENFDHAVRSWEQLEHFRRYISGNPRKAGLKEGEFLCGRGKRGVLRGSDETG